MSASRATSWAGTTAPRHKAPRLQRLAWADCDDVRLLDWSGEEVLGLRMRAWLTALSCGAGAVAAHSLAGGRVDLITAVLSVVVPVALARLLVHKRLSLAGAGLVAIGSQATLHLVFITSCASEVGCLLTPAQMVAAHLLAAAFSVTVAMGGERALLRVVRAAAASLGLGRQMELPTLPMPARVVAYTPELSTAGNWVIGTLSARGPPSH